VQVLGSAVDLPAPENVEGLAVKGQTGRLGRGKQLASNLSPGIIDGMDVEIGLSALDPRDQGCFGLRKPAL
jgi:hypothetical protein